ncbi:MAG: SDR family oxidoreductase [Rubellimicrobium sp.]|nr:SDR family oxidoreductase [Rubellimicrobium sp.]
MHVLITGAAGMLGRKIVAQIAAGGIGGQAVTRLGLADVVPAPVPAGFAGTVDALTGNLADAGVAAAWLAGKPDVILHLAAVVSAEAESDFDKGYAVNLDGTRALFDGIRALGYHPRVVMASSIAVFGAPFPEKIGDEFFNAPLTSYGTQKAMADLLLSDYTRKGIFDGVALRLPTLIVRPGKPNKAASGFFSSILREPLVGQEALLPVGDDVRHWFASPRRAAGFFAHAAAMDTARIGPRRALNMPGLSATIGEMIEALRRVAGSDAVACIRRVDDPVTEGIVAGWARDFDPVRARALGFVADASLDEIIRIHIEDDLGGSL